jgi:hypothetical protein
MMPAFASSRARGERRRADADTATRVRAAFGLLRSPTFVFAGRDAVGPHSMGVVVTGLPAFARADPPFPALAVPRGLDKGAPDAAEREARRDAEAT